MRLSANLAQLNHDRFAAFATTPSADDLRPAAYAFDGDTYQGLEIRTMNPEDIAYAQDHLRILSGLYGVLRPLDGIQAYRLEMGSRLKTRHGASLYAVWGASIAQALRTQAEETGAQAILNCASAEYVTAVDPATLGLPVITPKFLEEKNGKATVVGFYAKRARGAMARYVMENRLTSGADLEAFTTGGYRFDPEASTPEQPVFRRPSPSN